jgi:hypothetical protein
MSGNTTYSLISVKENGEFITSIGVVKNNIDTAANQIYWICPIGTPYEQVARSRCRRGAARDDQ